jgi:hypothetical protein
VSPAIRERAEPIVGEFLKRTDHSSKVINMLLNDLCVSFSSLDPHNHCELLDFLSRQQDLIKCSRELTMHYLALSLSHTAYTPLNEHLRDEII